MSRVRDALKRLTLTHVLLLAVTVFLCMNWIEQRTTNHTLKSLVRAVYMVDCDLSSDNCFVPKEYQAQ